MHCMQPQRNRQTAFAAYGCAYAGMQMTLRRARSSPTGVSGLTRPPIHAVWNAMMKAYRLHV